MQPLTGPYVCGVNRRSGSFLLLSDLLFCVRKVYQKQIKTCRKSCCFGLCIQFYDVLEGDLYRPDQE